MSYTALLPLYMIMDDYADLWENYEKMVYSPSAVYTVLLIFL